MYLDRKQLRPATVATYSGVINNCLQSLLYRPIIAKTEQMVQIRHSDLLWPNHMGTTGQFWANAAMRTVEFPSVSCGSLSSRNRKYSDTRFSVSCLIF